MNYDLFIFFCIIEIFFHIGSDFVSESLNLVTLKIYSLFRNAVFYLTRKHIMSL